jgi:hypothetical protein
MKGYSCLFGETLHLLSFRPYLIYFKRRDVVGKTVVFHKDRHPRAARFNTIQDLVARILICGGAVPRQAAGGPQNRTFQIVNMATTVPACRRLKECRKEKVLKTPAPEDFHMERRWGINVAYLELKKGASRNLGIHA